MSATLSSVVELVMWKESHTCTRLRKILRNNKRVVEPAKRATLEDVAALAKVSVTTASRVLTRRGELRADTRDSVLAAAKELGYNRNSTSRGRTVRRTMQHIELVLGAFESPWSEEVITGARQQAFELGFDLVLTQERENPVEDWPIRIANRRSSGVILGLIMPTRSQLKMLAGFEVPTVLLDPWSDPPDDLQSVGSTNFLGGQDAAKHLVEFGYSSFAIATSHLRYRFGRARERGFREQIEKRLPGSQVALINVDWDGTLDIDSLKRALASSHGSRLGIFAVNDVMAKRLVKALAESGVAVPDRVGVVGFDDEPDFASGIALTTIRQPIQEMARKAVQLIQEAHTDEVSEKHWHELETELIVRSTTSKSSS
jgi:LacI family transcriptional regulator